jgi:hypothetical protein
VSCLSGSDTAFACHDRCCFNKSVVLATRNILMLHVADGSCMVAVLQMPVAWSLESVLLL